MCSGTHKSFKKPPTLCLLYTIAELTTSCLALEVYYFIFQVLLLLKCSPASPAVTFLTILVIISCYLHPYFLYLDLIQFRLKRGLPDTF